MDLWQTYLLAYAVVTLFYIVYRYSMALNYDRGMYDSNYKSAVSVIIPFYNERVDLILRTIGNVNSCYGDKQIIVIDDGSTSTESYDALLGIKKKIDFELIRYEKNMGKRYAQCIGFRKSKNDVIVTVDSDTILDKNALLELVKPLSCDKVGATTGQLEALNENDNFLTRMQGARYWNAFNFERRSQSLLGTVVCCSGPISAYRRSIIMDIIEDYENQTFMGKRCTFGDDRHLTTLILKKGYDVLFVEGASGYTEVPSGFRQFLRQQIRWKKSFIRETIISFGFMFKRGFALPFEVCFQIFITLFSLAARLSLIIGLVFHPSYVFIVFPMLFLMSCIHSLFVLFFSPKKFVFSVAYGFVHAFIIYWLFYVAIASFGDTGWGTR